MDIAWPVADQWWRRRVKVGRRKVWFGRVDSGEQGRVREKDSARVLLHLDNMAGVSIHILVMILSIQFIFIHSVVSLQIAAPSSSMKHKIEFV